MNALKQELYGEWLKLIRDPAFVLPSIGFPLGFFVLFGLILPFAKSPDARLSLMANYSAFAILASAMFAASLPLAKEREFGVFALKRCTPLSLPDFVAAKIIAATLFGLFAASTVLLIGFVSYQIMPSIVGILMWLVFGAVAAFATAALGLLIGSYFRSNAAPGVVNLVFMPLAFFGGLALPMAMLPKLLQSTANVLPSFHIGALLRYALGAQSLTAQAWAVSCVVLFAYGGLALWLSARKLAASAD